MSTLEQRIENLEKVVGLNVCNEDNEWEPRVNEPLRQLRNPRPLVGVSIAPPCQYFPAAKRRYKEREEEYGLTN